MSVVSYKCPNCGGPLLFNPDKQTFSCEYCTSDFSEPQLAQHNKKLDEELENQQADANVKEDTQQNANQEKTEDFSDGVVYICNSCGAQVVTSSTTAATECYYCHNPVVLGGRLSGELKPDKAIPFKISRESAIEKFEQACKKKKFLPKGFFNKKQVEKMTGVYFPYWYYDSENQVSYAARAKKVRTWTTGNTRYTETKIYDVERQGIATINNLFYSALSKDDQLMLKSVHPFDIDNAKDFSMTYLSGFQAEKRDVEKEQVIQSALNDVNKNTNTLINNTVSEYTSVTKRAFDMKEIKNLWEYTLLPVWVITYKHANKIYPYAINGETGKMFGSLPVDMKKLSIFSSIVAAAIIGIFLIGGLFL